jgi:hypothetical protein
MSTNELQERIIQKVLRTNDTQLLDYLDHLLTENKDENIYKLSDFEKSILNESYSDYESGIIISEDEVFKRNQKWLEK